MPSRPTTERRFATAANRVNRLCNSRVYVPTGTINSPIGVIRLRDWFRYLKAKSAMKVCTVCGIPKITIGITGFALGWGDGIEEPYWVFQGGKTFCASFCASLTAGSRRAFLCVDFVFVCCWSSE